jgi:nucleotide sugar dehydrogenase
MKDNPQEILVIGLGEIGYNNAEYMSGIGLDVAGYDINPKALKRALEAGIIKKETKTFKDYDYYMICVSTHNPANMFVPYLDGLIDVAERIAAEGKPGALVTIESTIPKGTSKKVCEILEHRLHVAHVPHRYFNQEKIEHGVRQLRVLAGCQSCCSNEALQFYKHVLDIPTYTLTSIELAELTKIIENTHRFLEIAFAEELKMFCANQDLDFTELRDAVNTKWNENIMEARKGIGGHCLPKDTKMYYELSKHLLPSSIVSAAMKSNDLYEGFCKQDFIFIEPIELVTVNSLKKERSLGVT